VKIESYKFSGSLIKVYTDEGEFTYPADRYGSVAEIEVEIMKKLGQTNKNKLKKEKLLNDLVDKKIKEKELVLIGGV